MYTLSRKKTVYIDFVKRRKVPMYREKVQSINILVHKSRGLERAPLVNVSYSCLFNIR